MSMSNDTVYIPADIEVLPCNDKEVSLANSIIDITPCESTVIPVRKKEYSIVGDSFYAAINDGPTPPWLDKILDDVIDSLLTDHLPEITDANKNLLDAIFALDVAHNDYTEMIHIDVRVDQAISAHLTTLNSRLDDNDATIIHLDMNKVTPEMAAAISIDAISSSLDNGAISGRLASVDYSISTLAGNVTGITDLLESRYGELNEAIVELTTETGAAIDKVYSSFKYNSILKVGDERFRSGFGLNSEVKIPIPGQPGVYDSEFWIDAQRLKFTNSNQTGAVSPFTIDASGTIPQITFNGKVSFNSITDVPQLGSTPDEVVDAINNGNTTTIDGGRITTGSITADQINTTGLVVEGAADFAGDLKSTDFESGIQGWMLGKDGDIELNGAQIRGLLDFGQITVKGRPGSEVKTVPNTSTSATIPDGWIPKGSTTTTSTGENDASVTFLDSTPTGRFDVRGGLKISLNIIGSLKVGVSGGGDGDSSYFHPSFTVNASVTVYSLLNSSKQIMVAQKELSFSDRSSGSSGKNISENFSEFISFSALGHIGTVSSASVGYRVEVSVQRIAYVPNNMYGASADIRASLSAEVDNAYAYLNRF